ncbi:MAG: GxxExxY protein [Chloroflexi bacterium]|nr:MAG: GxxExxY protein [Chloroflexota bacterium]
MAFQGKHSEITDKIIKAFFTVYNQLGHGFNEKVYENALVIELKHLGLDVTQQSQINVFYAGRVIGEYIADMIVNDVVILELKAVRQISEEHQAQLLNYLKATPIEVGLLMNFGPKPHYVRLVFDNERKGSLSWNKP